MVSNEECFELLRRIRCWIHASNPTNPATRHNPNIAPEINNRKLFHYLFFLIILPIRIITNSDESFDDVTPVGIVTDFEQISVWFIKHNFNRIFDWSVAISISSLASWRFFNEIQDGKSFEASTIENGIW